MFTPDGALLRSEFLTCVKVSAGVKKLRSLPTVHLSFATLANLHFSLPDIDIHYQPTLSDLESYPQTMREVLLSLPGFTASKIRNIHNRNNKNNKKLSAAAAVQLAHEGCIDIDSPDSILGQVNIRSLLNKSTFQKLPASFQFKLMHLLPQVDIISEDKSKNLK